MKLVHGQFLERPKGQLRERALVVKVAAYIVSVHQLAKGEHQGDAFEVEAGKFVFERGHKEAQREEVHPLGQRVDHVHEVARLGREMRTGL